MRNLKKILALVLALVMSMSLLATANAFNDDAEIDPTYDEAVTVLANLGVFQGYNNGETFVPKGSITRAEVAAILYRIATGDVDDTQVGIYADYNKFSDVKSTSWYAGYVNYCANAEYIKGYDDKTFGPNDPVTGYQALAMILRAVGYDANGEFTGNGWQVNVASYANQLGLTRNVSAGTLATAATREVVAEILFRTIAEAYVVKYTAALGYQPVYLATSSNKPGSLVLFDGVNFGATLGGQTFGLARTTGEITAVGRTAGTTTLGNWNAAGTVFTANTAVVTNTNTPWTDIGYAAYVYTVPTAGAKTLAAVSDLVITGESVAVNTAANTARDIEPLITVNGSAQIATLDTPYNVYYNGMLLGTTQIAGYWWNAADWAVYNGNNKVEVVNGLKVDFIDNDDGGLVEAIVFTEYTVAKVAGIASTTNTGSNAYITDCYYFTPLSIGNPTAVEVKKANLVSSADLAVGNLVTYVQYAGDTYVTVAPSATGVFTQINYRVVNPATDISYVIGGQTYVKANDDTTVYMQDYYQGPLYTVNGVQTDVLTTANAANKANLIVYTDPYGYMLYVDYAPTTSQYVYVVTNEDTNMIPGTTDVQVVNTDGSVSTMSITGAKLAGNTTYTKSFYRADLRLIDDIYNVAGTNLDYACTGHVYDTTYVKGTSTLAARAYFTTASIVVDVRGVLAGTATAGTVYTGYAEIPTMYNMDIHYVTDANGFITVAFITDGDNDASKEFVVYTTGANYFDGQKYNLPVIMDGQQTTLALTPGEYAAIQALGVGLYEYNINGTMKTFTGYTSFEELWTTVTWGNGAIVVNGVSYAYSDSVNFWALDITNGAAYKYSMVSGTDTQTYVVFSGNKATDIYVIKGSVVDHTGTVTPGTAADNNTIAAVLNGVTYTKDAVVGGDAGYYQYYKLNGYVTKALFVKDDVYTVSIDGEVQYANVVSGTKVSLPDSVKGTGYKIDGTTTFVPEDEQYTVTGDVNLLSGYVAWTLEDGTTDAAGNKIDLTKAVRYAAGTSGSPRFNEVFDNLSGNHLWVVRYQDGGEVGQWKNHGQNTAANCNSYITDGYYKVTIAGTDDDNVVTLDKGTLLSGENIDNRKVVYTTANKAIKDGTYYTTYGTVLNLHTDGTSTGDDQYTAGPNDVNINIVP